MGVGVRAHLVVGEDILEDEHICVLATSLEFMILLQVIKYIIFIERDFTEIGFDWERFLGYRKSKEVLGGKIARGK